MDIRIAIVVLAAFAVVFAATVGFSVVRHQDEAPSAGRVGEPPPTRGGEVDRDRLEEWRPPGSADVAARALGPFVPSLGLTQPNVTLPALESRTRTAPPSGSDLRIAQLTLVAGAGAVVVYDCNGDENGRQCPQTTCLCRPGAELADLDVSDCDERWVRHRRQSDAILCLKDDDAGSLIIYEEGGDMLFTGIGTDRVTVRVR